MTNTSFSFFNELVFCFLGLESVTHYPMLAVVAGTLSQLVMRTSEEW